MNRRKFISLSLILGGGAIAGFYGNKFIKANGAPNLDYLKSQSQLIAELAEQIIPRTNTPGAKDCSVEIFIIDQVTNHLNRKSSNNFIYGLQDLVTECESKFNQSFINLTPSNKQLILKQFEEDARSINEKLAKVKNKLFGKPFFTVLKELTTIGYCTSLKGSTMGLNYMAIPGKYIAINNYHKGQRSWATK